VHPPRPGAWISVRRAYWCLDEDWHTPLSVYFFLTFKFETVVDLFLAVVNGLYLNPSLKISKIARTPFYFFILWYALNPCIFLVMDLKPCLLKWILELEWTCDSDLFKD
jgi:hypothetical protein